MVRSGLFQGEGLLQTSTLVARRADLLSVPFLAGLRRHQEWDWLLRALPLPGWGLEFVETPLCIWYVEDGRAAVSARNEWRYSHDWIRSMRGAVTPRAYAAFVLVLVGAMAAGQGDRTAFRFLLRDAVKNGSPRPIDFLLFTGMWILPQERRRALRALAAKLRGT